MRCLRGNCAGVNVRLWHFADIDADAEHVRYSGVKRTWPIRAPMSANDPKRTSLCPRRWNCYQWFATPAFPRSKGAACRDQSKLARVAAVA